MKVWVNMSQKYIRDCGVLVEVTKEVYKEYYSMERQERYQVERDLSKGTFSFDSLCRDDMTAEDFISDREQKTVEEQVELKLMSVELKKVLERLNKDEKELIYQVYFLGKSIRTVASETGIPNSVLARNHNKILSKLKAMLS